MTKENFVRKLKKVMGYVMVAICSVGLCTGGFFVGKFYAVKKYEYGVKMATYNSLSEWEIIEMAIIKTESEFNTQAVGKTNDVGIFQITPIYVKEANRLIGGDEYTHTDAFIVEKSIEMFNIIQGKSNPKKDIGRAVEIHNPNGASIHYPEKVMSNYRYIKRMEEVREELIKYRQKTINEE